MARKRACRSGEMRAWASLRYPFSPTASCRAQPAYCSSSRWFTKRLSAPTSKMATSRSASIEVSREQETLRIGLSREGPMRDAYKRGVNPPRDSTRLRKSESRASIKVTISRRSISERPPKRKITVTFPFYCLQDLVELESALFVGSNQRRG